METIDARIIDGEVTAITRDRVVMTVVGRQKTFERRDVAEIVFGESQEAMTLPGRAVVVTTDGGNICAEQLALAGGKLSITSKALGRLSMSISAASAIYLPGGNRSAAGVERRCREMEFAATRRDVLVAAKKDDTWIGIEGVVKSISDKAVTLHWKNEDKATDRKGVRAVLLAKVTTRPVSLAGTLVARDGSTLSFALATLSGGKFSLDVPGVGALDIDRKAVASIRFLSERVANLPDLRPGDVKQYGFFDEGFPYRVNRSVGGGPLRLGGRVYQTGLGLHSYAKLTYKLNGAYTAFVAVVGIDESVHPNGDARLVFLGDGKELIPPLRLTGKDKPQTVRLKLKGVREFIIQVGFGEDKLDVSDHVNIAAARLIK